MNTPPGSNVNSDESARLAAAAAGDEAALVRRAAEGQADARRELFERYREVAYRVAFRITGRHEDALDVVQDGFIKAFAGLDGFLSESGFRTWLSRIVANRALDILRARKVRLAVPLAGGGDNDDGGGVEPAAPDDAAISAGLERAELGARLNAALEQLSPEQRTVFSMFATGEMTYGEIAEAVGIPIGTVMSRIFHARRRLRELLPEFAGWPGATAD